MLQTADNSTIMTGAGPEEKGLDMEQIHEIVTGCDDYKIEHEIRKGTEKEDPLGGQPEQPRVLVPELKEILQLEKSKAMEGEARHKCFRSIYV